MKLTILAVEPLHPIWTTCLISITFPVNKPPPPVSPSGNSRLFLGDRAPSLTNVVNFAFCASRYSVNGARCGCAQPRCWPPSSAIICPVMEGAARINRIAATISCGLGAAAERHLRALPQKMLRALPRAGSIGPGPIPLTRIRGASASAIVWVNVHSPVFRNRVGNKIRGQRPNPLVEHVDDDPAGRGRQPRRHLLDQHKRARAD